MQYIFVKYLHLYILGLGDIVKFISRYLLAMYVKYQGIFTFIYIYIYIYFTYRTMLSNETMHIKGYENTNNVNLSLYIILKRVKNPILF